jgi:hypothetical protein
MEENKALLLSGYSFELTEYICADGITTITVRVAGNGEHPCDISSWALEICPGDADKFNGEVCIVACEKRRRNGAWQNAAAMKTTPELTGDIRFSGVVIDEWVDRYAEDPPTEFRITLDAELPPEPVRIAFVAGETVYESTERLIPRQNLSGPQLWNTPIEKLFCLYLVVPDGYKPHGACRANVSISRRGIFLASEPETEAEGALCAQLCREALKSWRRCRSKATRPAAIRWKRARATASTFAKRWRSPPRMKKSSCAISPSAPKKTASI